MPKLLDTLVTFAADLVVSQSFLSKHHPYFLVKRIELLSIVFIDKVSFVTEHKLDAVARTVFLCLFKPVTNSVLLAATSYVVHQYKYI